MSIVSRLYYFSLLSLIFSISSGSVALANQTPLTSEQQENNLQESFIIEGFNLAQVSPPQPPAITNTADLDEQAEGLGIIPIVSNSSSLIGIFSSDSHIEQFNQYPKSNDNEIELSLEAKTTSKMPTVVVLIRGREATRVYHISRLVNDSPRLMIERSKSVVIRVDSQQGRLYIADNDAEFNFYSIFDYWANQPVPPNAGDIDIVWLRQDEAAYVNYRNGSGGDFGDSFTAVSLFDIQDFQNDYLSLDGHRIPEQLESRVILQMKDSGDGGGVHDSW